MNCDLDIGNYILYTSFSFEYSSFKLNLHRPKNLRLPMMFSLFMIIWQVGRRRISLLLYWKLRLPNVLEFRSLCEVIDSFAVEKKRSHLHDLEHPGQFLPVDGVQVFQVDPSPAHTRPHQVVLGAKCRKDWWLTFDGDSIRTEYWILCLMINFWRGLTWIFKVMFGLLHRMVFTLVPNTLESLFSVCISLVSMIRLYLSTK